MWSLTVRSPDSKPNEYLLKPGANNLGRRKGNDIVIADEAASRLHAQLHLDDKTNSITIRDLGSRNGTFINRRRLTAKHDFRLAPNDVVRIGMYEILLSIREEPGEEAELDASGFQPFSRELLLESFDNHAVLLYEVIQQLNNVLDVDVALKEVSRLLRLTLGADKCRVILAEDFNRIMELGFPTSIADFAIENRTTVLLPSRGPESKQLMSESARTLRVHTVLCVPVVSADKVIALIYMYKTRSDTRHFSRRDMQLAVAVGHLAALTIERVSLIERVREEQRVRQLLQRFVAPTEAEFLLRTYLDSGSLPVLQELQCTVMFADIAQSSRLAESLGPRPFGELLNRYFQDVTNIIFQYGGLIDKYLGDGFMAVFGMSGKQKNPEQNAVAAGLEIIKLLEARYREPDKHIVIGIGINTGMVVAGYVSTKERVELSVLGDAVNVAAGLESMARPNRILLGPLTTDAVKDSYSLELLGEQTIKGRTQPLLVHEVKSR
ncbi:MAG: FHA domain-containing protein [Chloroflexi bacterium]|nr:FHA domain-containing protein [Chloroflexota bacterium]